ncbi:hypothetical protein ACWC9T_13940 [Kitasatospora sp. NPDC001159]
MAALDLLGRRWALRVLWELSQSPCGCRELQRRCERMSSSVWTTSRGRRPSSRAETRESSAADGGGAGGRGGMMSGGVKRACVVETISVLVP